MLDCPITGRRNEPRAVGIAIALPALHFKESANRIAVDLVCCAHESTIATCAADCKKKSIAILIYFWYARFMPEKLVPVTTRLPESLRKKLRLRAIQEGVKLETLMRQLLEAGMKVTV